MKKIIALILIGMMSCLCGCSESGNKSEYEKNVTPTEENSDFGDETEGEDASISTPALTEMATSAPEPTEIENDTEKDVSLKEYQGVWYGYGTDSTGTVTGELTLTFLDNKRVKIGDQIFIMIDNYTAESEKDCEGSPEACKQLLEFGTDGDGDLALNGYMIRKDTRMQISESMYYYRTATRENYQDFIILGEISKEQAEKDLRNWIGDLGTWVSGEDNILTYEGVFGCDGKRYYQFALKGFVTDHYSTLTRYVVPADGSEIFEGECFNGYLNKYIND